MLQEQATLQVQFTLCVEVLQKTILQTGFVVCARFFYCMAW